MDKEQLEKDKERIQGMILQLRQDIQSLQRQIGEKSMEIYGYEKVVGYIEDNLKEEE